MIRSLQMEVVDGALPTTTLQTLFTYFRRGSLNNYVMESTPGYRPTYSPETQITNAESYIDWLAVRNPKIAETIRLKNVESFGNMEGHHEAEPTVF